MPNFVHTSVNPEKLSRVAKSVDLDLDMINSALQSIRSAVMDKLRPTWSGPASEEFFTQYAGGSASINNLLKHIREYNERLERAAGVYDTADSEADDAVSNLSIE